MIRAHRIALDPTVEQVQLLIKACGVSRFTWNWALSEYEKQIVLGERPSCQKLQKQWNAIKAEQFPWVYESPKDANQRPFSNLNKAFSSFFAGITGRPGFRVKGRYDSFYVSNCSFVIRDKSVKIYNLGIIPLRENLRLLGKIVAATVSREADRWFLSVQVESEAEKLPVSDKSIGIDLGLKTALVCSGGQTFEAPKPLQANLQKLRRLSKAHSRKQKGFNNRKKSQHRLARLHTRIKNIRRDWSHKVTTELIRENQTICLEDLNVRGMMANRRLSRAISDVGWYELRRQLTYKAEWYGREVRFIGRFLPSSKTCSNCGCRKDTLALSERVFRCTDCGFELDRDLNAARNILAAGLAVSACGPEGSGPDLTIGTKPCRDEAGTSAQEGSSLHGC